MHGCHGNTTSVELFVCSLVHMSFYESSHPIASFLAFGLALGGSSNRLDQIWLTQLYVAVYRIRRLKVLVETWAALLGGCIWFLFLRILRVHFSGNWTSVFLLRSEEDWARILCQGLELVTRWRHSGLTSQGQVQAKLFRPEFADSPF